MKKKVMAISLVLALFLSLGVGCGGRDIGGEIPGGNTPGGNTPGGNNPGQTVDPIEPVDPDAKTITVYRYQTLGISSGKEDNVVKKAIEDKFYADTGIKINLDVKMFTHSDLPTQVDANWSRRGADIDGVLHYISEDHGCATLRYATISDTVKEMTPLVEANGSNIMKYIKQGDENATRQMSCYVREDGEGDFKMNYLVSVETEGKYGLLVNKTYMEAVKDITGLDPADYDAASPNHKSMTISEFERFLSAVRDNLSDRVSKYPLIGAPWDIDYTIANVFGADAYSIQQEVDGKYAPAQFAPALATWYDTIQRWAAEGLWEPESLNVADSTRRSWFAAGQAAVYSADPTIENLITTARLAKANGAGDIMLIAPLADDTGKVNGYTQPYAPDGLIIPDKSDDSETLIKYIDWLYSDTENYDLAAYGVKGTHWVEGDDFTVNGNTYKTWRYPDAKSDEYKEDSPYNGRYLLLRNVNVSNRVRGDYNSTEKKWYDLVTTSFPIWHSNTIEGIWIGSTPRKYAAQYNDLEGFYVDDIRAYAWVGKLNNGKTCSESLEEYIVECHKKDQDYLDWLNETVSAAKAFKQEKFGK